jgi:uncharacterized membrane protein
MVTWVVLVAVGIGTYLLRLSMLVLLADRPLGARASASLELVAPAALAALVTMMLSPRQEGTGPAEIVAVLAGFAASRRSGNVLHAFVAGVPVYVLLHAIELSIGG